ncbi:MAG: alpha/beta hydrolase [Oceanospirillaceae bacterium]|nr:alpha/beta hydrolase [Oceanospirillaceae bacterium]
MINERDYPIHDWDDAYSNANYITAGDQYLSRWSTLAAQFKAQLSSTGETFITLQYAQSERNTLDLFLPASPAKGLIVFVHGGYWMMFDKDYWSHLARGALASGYAFAIPSYTLCPQASIGNIVQEIATAIECAAQQVTGEIRLCGHSAGGHLVTSMLCQNTPLSDATFARIVNTLSISGVHDLRVLLNTALNQKLQLDMAAASALSPALNMPKGTSSLTCWVGGDERPEFKRQNLLLAQMWKSFAIKTQAIQEPEKHHFNIIEGLLDADHPMMRALLN